MSDLTGNFKNPMYATRTEEELALPLSITEAANIARDFIDNLPNNLIDIDLGDGLL